MKKVILLAIAVCFLFSVSAVFAEEAAVVPAGTAVAPEKTPGIKDPGVNKRQKKQKNRIKQGIKSGELTKEEAKELREDGKEIREMEKTMKADGTMTKDERKQLHQELNERSKDIKDLKHNDAKRKKAK